MDLEKDLNIITYRFPPGNLNAPYRGVRFIHKETGISFSSHVHRSSQQNHFECFIQIKRLVREFYNHHEIIPFKYFKLILEK